MSDIIQLLPDSVANQIAAGEVIQRPANVIKELVENSIDAGAKTINVVVVDAGKTTIQVVDDGKGMSETDARLAFERHATSKIRKADDLFTLHTMGFRGEALPSIAAVAQVELRTRQADQEVGTLLTINGANNVTQVPCACPVGCNFLVNNIFYCLPARRRFLGKPATEQNHILTAFERIALVYPDINFTLHSNGGEVYNLRAGNMLQRISDIFGKKIGKELLPINEQTSLCRISGYVGSPESARKKCPHQYFFVNGRFMKHPYFAKAVQTAFERLLPTGEQVPYFIYFEVDPSEIDVNISPTKTDIKFENEQAIWQILAAAVREAVGIYHEVPSIDFDVHGKPEIPMFDGTGSTMIPASTGNPEYNPFKTQQRPQSVTPGWEKLYESQITKSETQDADIFSMLGMDDSNASPTDDKATEHYQYKGKYIVTSVKGGLMLIDQHRAHIRVLYNQYMRQISEQKPVSQGMLFPEAVQFSACEASLLDAIVDEMTLMGFELTPLGACNYAINSVPAGLEGLNPSTLVQEMVEEVLQTGTSVKDEINHSLAISLARKASIPYGQILTNDEMDDLTNRLLACSDNSYTPDGKKTFVILKHSDIEQMLG